MVTLGDAAARGTGVTLMTQGVRVLAQFGSVAVLARLLTPADFGLVAMVLAVIGIADIFRDFGLSSAAIQAKDLSEAERTNLFWANFALGLGCALASIIAIPLIVAIYSDDRLAAVVIALSTVFVLSGANTQFRADLARDMRFHALATSDVVSQICGIAVAIAMAALGWGYWAIVCQQIVAAAVVCAMNVVSCRWWPGLPRRGASLRRFFRFGGGILGTQGVHYVTKNVDNVALGAVWGPTVLGLYSRAYQLLMTPLNAINAPMTRVALPVLSRIQEDDETFARYLAKVQLVACYLTATVFAVAAGLATPLVLVLFGPDWSEVAPIFAILAIGGIFRAVVQIAYWIYLARGLTAAQMKLYLATGPFMILIILAGLPWGAIGVAVGHSVAYFAMWIIQMLHVGRVARVDVRPLFRKSIRSILLVSAPCGIAAFLGSLIPAPPVLRLAAGLAAAAIYLLTATTLVHSMRTDATTVLAFGRRALGRTGARRARSSRA